MKGVAGRIRDKVPLATEKERGILLRSGCPYCPGFYEIPCCTSSESNFLLLKPV